MPETFADLVQGEMNDRLQMGASDVSTANAVEEEQQHLLQTAGCPPPSNGCHTMGCR